MATAHRLPRLTGLPPRIFCLTIGGRSSPFKGEGFRSDGYSRLNSLSTRQKMCEYRR
jgi:hypothetical protein